jgi:hypothetical protein
MLQSPGPPEKAIPCTVPALLDLTGKSYRSTAELPSVVAIRHLAVSRLLVSEPF